MCSYAVDEESEEVFDAADMTYFTAKLESVVQLDNVVLLGDNCGERGAKDGKLHSIVNSTVFCVEHKIECCSRCCLVMMNAAPKADFTFWTRHVGYAVADGSHEINYIIAREIGARQFDLLLMLRLSQSADVTVLNHRCKIHVSLGEIKLRKKSIRISSDRHT